MPHIKFEGDEGMTGGEAARKDEGGRMKDEEK
jgi:hypothetical protein